VVLTKTLKGVGTEVVIRTAHKQNSAFLLDKSKITVQIRKMQMQYERDRPL
jgi:hypothetical protein